jgi:putative sterol carrier protein
MRIEDVPNLIEQRMSEGNIQLERPLSISFGDQEARCVYIDGSAATVRDSSEGAACILQMTPDDLMALIQGELDKTQAYIDGRISVTGDMTVAMKLGELF